MGGAKETPRQKMIGLMYLVLMALLAMNVSKEVINAFITMNNNLESQNGNLALANGEQVDILYGKYNSPEIKGKAKEDAKKLYELGISIHDMTRNVANFYMSEADAMLQKGDDSRTWITEVNDGFLSIIDLMAEDSDYSRKDDYDIPTYMFVGDNHNSINARGVELVNKLNNFRDSLCILIANKPKPNNQGNYTFVPPVLNKETELDSSWLVILNKSMSDVKEEDKKYIVDIYRILTLPQKIKNHGELYPWQAAQFDHAPIVAAAGVFTSLKSRVLQAERIALNNLNAQSDTPIFKFNAIEPLAFAPTGYINSGDSLQLSVMIAAYDTLAKSEIRYWINDTIKAGHPMITTLNQLKLGGKIGRHTIVGDIAIQTKSGIEWKPWKFEYNVGTPNASVSPYDLNVLYSGYENKIKVAAGGFAADQISATCSGCESFNKSGDFYIAKVKGINGKAYIKVAAKTDDGKTVQLANEEFRIFPKPKPVVKFAGVGYETKSILKVTAENCPAIQLITESPINITYNVTSFIFQLIGGTKSGGTLKSNSNKLTQEMKDAIKNAQKGVSILFSDIRANSNGADIPVPPLMLNLN